VHLVRIYSSSKLRFSFKDGYNFNFCVVLLYISIHA
jgi:hypothetical protein